MRKEAAARVGQRATDLAERLLEAIHNNMASQAGRSFNLDMGDEKFTVTLELKLRRKS